VLSKLERMDPRIVYLLLAVGVSLPLIWPIGLPLDISPETQQVFDRIERLAEGAKVMLSYDYSAGGLPELDAGVRAMLSHLSKKNAKVVAVASTTEGPMYASETLEVYESLGKKYGEDYVNLGYFAGGEGGLSALCRDIKQVFKKDFHGTDVDSLELMSAVGNVNDFDLVVSFNIGPTDGATTPAWVRIVHNEYGVSLILYVVTVMAPANMPYLQARQLDGLLSGLKSGAEYEQLLQEPGSAVAAMDAQSISHLIIVGLVILGNIALFATRREGVVGE
jgi:hypothetical protein